MGKNNLYIIKLISSKKGINSRAGDRKDSFVSHGESDHFSPSDDSDDSANRKLRELYRGGNANKARKNKHNNNLEDDEDFMPFNKSKNGTNAD